MEFISVDVKQNQECVVMPLGDLQYTGNDGNTAIDLLKQRIETGLKLKAKFLGLGDFCLPLRAKILTRSGFKHRSDLVIGEDVLVYDAASGTNKWSPLVDILIRPTMPMMHLKGKSFHVTASPHHRWFATSGSGKYRKNVVRTTATFKRGDRIRVAAKAESGDSNMTPREAAILGWIVTDGHVRTEPTLNVTISQTKKKYYKHIKELIGEECTGEYQSGTCDNCGHGVGAVTFHLNTAFARHLFNKAGFKSKADLVGIVTRLSSEARAAMLDAMMQAEGYRYNSTRAFTQSVSINPDVLHAFKVLATLEGQRLNSRKITKFGIETVTLVQSNYVTYADLDVSMSSDEAAWCPRTAYGSWVTELDGQITITGNTDFLSPSNRAKLTSAHLYDTAKDVIDAKAIELVHELYDKALRPTKGHWLGLLEGHHYHQLQDGTTTDMLFADMLEAPFLGTTCLGRLNFGVGDVTFWATHGCGGGAKASAPLNKLEALAPYWEANIFIIGHMSKLASAPINRCYPVWDGPEPELMHRKICLVGSGSFARGYQERSKQGNVPRGGYTEHRMLSPVTLGSPIIRVTPQVKETRIGSKVIKRWNPDISVEV